MGKYLEDPKLNKVLESYFQEGINDIINKGKNQIKEFSANKYKNIIKDIILKSQIKEKVPLLRVSYDNKIVNNFISNLKKEFKNKVVYSNIVHVTGDYNYYYQSFVAIKDKTLIKFTVNYNGTNITHTSLTNTYLEKDLSNCIFDENMILILYNSVLKINAEYIYPLSGFTIKDDNIKIVSFSQKLVNTYNSIRSYENKYNIELNKNGFELIITSKI